MKKLTLSHKKCNRIHIGKSKEVSQDLKVHESKMNNTEREKYLGDFIDNAGKLRATLDDRVAKGRGIVSEIKAILNKNTPGKI